MLRLLVQQSSSKLLAAPVGTHHLRHLSAPCSRGRRSDEVACACRLPAAHPICMQSRSVHVCCKRPSKIDDTLSASVHQILTSSCPFLQHTNVTCINKQFMSRNGFGSRHQHHNFSSTSNKRAKSRIPEKELKREIDDLTDKFMETRELLEDAMESKGTVYFNDDLQDAKDSVQETLSQFEELMTKLSEDQEKNVRRTIGLKMEELRAQEAMIDESLKED